MKGHVVAIEGEQPVIADRDPMGIAPEIAQHGRCATKGRLGVDHPVGLEKRVDEGAPLRRVMEVSGAAGEIELVPVVGAPQRVDKLPAKDPTQDFHGEEEARVLRVHPALVIERESARRHDQWTCGWRTRVWPQVWRILSTPISAPRWRESAATSRSVAALA